MNKGELVNAISDDTGVGRADVEKVLNGLADTVMGCVSRGEKVSITGFASFEQTSRSARMGRNPKTGEAIHIPASKGCKISAGSKLKAAAKGS